MLDKLLESLMFAMFTVYKFCDNAGFGFLFLPLTLTFRVLGLDT